MKKVNNDTEIESLLQQLRDSQGPGDSLIEINGNNVKITNGDFEIATSEIREQLINEHLKRISLFNDVERQMQLLIEKYGEMFVYEIIMEANKRYFNN